jgi:DegV family protein with EDD domain
MGQGWQVLAAAEAAEAGAGPSQVLGVVRSVQQRLRLLAALDTVEYLRRGGRASAVTALLGEVLQIKPLLEVSNGEVRPLARVRTRHKARETLVAHVDALGPLERLAVLHVAAPAEAQDLASRLARCLAPGATQPPVVVEATAVIGTHVGPGTLGLAAVMAQPLG